MTALAANLPAGVMELSLSDNQIGDAAQQVVRNAWGGRIGKLYV